MSALASCAVLPRSGTRSTASPSRCCDRGAPPTAALREGVRYQLVTATGVPDARTPALTRSTNVASQRLTTGSAYTVAGGACTARATTSHVLHASEELDLTRGEGTLEDENLSLSKVHRRVGQQVAAAV